MGLDELDSSPTADDERSIVGARELTLAVELGLLDLTISNSLVFGKTRVSL